MAKSPKVGPGARSLVTGAFHPALEDALLAHIEGRVKAAPLTEVPVVVPTNLLGLRLSRLLAGRMGGHANVRFMTMKDFALSVAGTPLADGRVLLPKGADEVALRKLLDGGLAQGGYFESIADKPGLGGALLAAIRDVKEACYTVDTLADAAREAGLLRKGRDCKLTELVRIWRAYEVELQAGGWADTLDAMAAAVVRIASEAAAVPDRLTVYGFYDLNSLQRSLIAGHAARAGLSVFFPFIDVASFDYARPTLEWFEGLGLSRTDLPVEDRRDIPLPDKLHIVSAPGAAREAREDVRELTRLLDERDASFQSAAVLARSPDRYSDVFREEFENLGARPYLESPPPLSRCRAGRSLVKLAEAAVADFARVEVMEFLSLADIDAGVDRPQVADWNKATILAGITSGAESWEERLVDLRGRLERAEESNRFALAHRHLLGPIGQLLPLVESIVRPLSRVPQRAPIGRYLGLLTNVFRNTTRRSKERELVLKSAGAMLALESIAGDVTPSYFLELLRAQLDEPGAREERFGTGGPAVLNLMAARGLSFPTVVLPGLVEKEFPAAHRQDPILLDAERERLNRARGNDPTGSLPIRSASIDEERLLYHLAVGSAEEVLLVSFPRLDPATARPRVPSPFVLRTLDELTGLRHDYERLESSELVTRIPLSRRFPEDRRRALTPAEFDGCSVLRALEEGDPSEVAYLVQSDGPLSRGLEMEKVRWGTPAFTKYDAMLTSPEAVGAIAELSGFARVTEEGSLKIAPTTLEQYARCPFAFFIGHVLGVEPMDEPEEALLLSPLEKGLLYHEVLEQFMRKAREDGLFPLTAEARDTLFEVAARVARAGSWSLSGVVGAQELALRNLLTGLSLWLAEEALEDAGYEPSYFEARFGGRLRPGDDETLSSEEGVPFEADGGVRVAFSGKIDRIDISGDDTGARVIDYKTGAARTGGRKVLDGGKRLQLPVYLMAASRLLEKAHPEATVDSAQYLYVGGSGGPGRMKLTREQLEGAMGDLATVVALIVRGISSGMFFSPPGDPGCSYCDYADACGSTATALSVMKSGDPRVEFYTEILSEIK
jgi:ATP-dependent helicase/nuclease subunit B